MKKILIVVCIFICAAQTCFAAITEQQDNNSGLYLSGRIGASIMPNTDLTDHLGDSIEKKMNTGAVVGLGVGYKYRNWRNEIELFCIDNPIYGVGYHGNQLDFSSGDTGIGAIMYNLYYDFDQLHSRLVPYVGAGIGWGLNFDEIKFNNGKKIETEGDSVMAFRGSAGVGYYVTQHFVMSLEYSYFATPRYTAGPNEREGSDFRGDLRTHFNAHLISLKLNYLFYSDKNKWHGGQ
jgi:opacity protein-like surface antigen